MSKKIIVNNPSHLTTTSYKNLKDLQGNLKTITKENLEKLKQSIIKHGIFVPKFVWIENNKNYWIEDGHQTIKALAALEKEGYIIPDIPYVKVDAKDKKDAAEKLLQINSRYGIVNPDTSFFEDFDIDLDFINDIEIPELDIKLDELEPEIVEDEVPEPPTEPLSKTGDLWICGKHRILCGDATKEADIVKLMDGKKADLVFTDPPYNVNYEYESYNDNKTEKEYQEFCKKWFEKFKNIKCIITPGTKNLSFWINLIPDLALGIWLKKNSHSGAKIAHLNNWEPILFIGKHLRNRDSDIFEYYVNSGFLRDESIKHTCPKPLSLIEELLKFYTDFNEKILDIFLGSGTTLIACETLNRICFGCEISEAYCDVILDRWVKLTNEDPIRTDGVKWSELKSSSEKLTD